MLQFDKFCFNYRQSDVKKCTAQKERCVCQKNNASQTSYNHYAYSPFPALKYLFRTHGELPQIQQKEIDEKMNGSCVNAAPEALVGCYFQDGS